MREWLKNKVAVREQKEQMERRERNVLPTKSYLTKSIEDCEQLSRSLLGGRNAEKRSLTASASKGHLNSLQKNLKAAVRELKYLRRREKGKIFEVFDNLYSVAGVALSKAESLDLPKPTAPNWDKTVSMINAVVMGDGGIRNVCGLIINRLDIFIEAQNNEALQTVAVQRAEQQVQQRQATKELAAASGSPAKRKLASRPAGVIRRR